MSGTNKIFEARSQQHAERTAILQQRELRCMSSPSNLHNFSVTSQQRIAADESAWAEPTYTNSEDNAEDMDYQQPRPGICYSHVPLKDHGQC